MKKAVGRFGLVAGISGFLMFSGVTPAVAGDIQSAYQTMQQALSEYRDAVTQQADQNLVRVKRDAYMAAKTAYEKLSKTASQTTEQVKTQNQPGAKPG